MTKFSKQGNAQFLLWCHSQDSSNWCLLFSLPSLFLCLVQTLVQKSWDTNEEVWLNGVFVDQKGQNAAAIIPAAQKGQ